MPVPEHAAYELLPVPVIITEGDRITYANPAAAALAQRPREELLCDWPSLIAGYFEDSELAPMKDTRPGDTDLWFRIRTPDGQQRHVVVRRSRGPREGERLFLLQDASSEGGPRGLLEALTDAGARLMHLRDEREVLHAAADGLYAQGFDVSILLVEEKHLHTAVVRRGPERTVALSRRLADALGSVPAALSIPLVDSETSRLAFERNRAIFHPDIRERVDPNFAPVAAAIIREFLPTRGVDAPIFVEGAPYALIGAHSDSLTPAGAAAIELFARHVGAAVENVRHHRRAQEQLEEMARLQKELVSQERLAALGEAAAVVSHEVRNPLGAVLNAVALLKRESAAPEDRRLALGIVEEEVVRLERLVRDLLDVARPMEARVRSVNLTALALQTARGLEERQPGLRISVEEEGAGNGALRPVDPVLMQLALENLLRNAAQVSPTNVRLTLGTSEEGQTVVAVEDSGPGIPEGDRQRIFEPFFTTRATGTGLGLAVVKRVVLAHGGKISVGPGAQGGARFELTFPASSPDDA